MNTRYKKIFDMKIESFINEMNKASVLYEDSTKHNKLINAGEYGVYKERTLKELIKSVIPFKYEITDGYVINSFDETSTQCDVIVYDKLNTPLIQSKDRFQFIPAESTLAIGEVKSKLTKKELIEAAIKLSRNKELCKPSSEFNKYNKEYNKELFPPFSFIICDTIMGINEKYTFKNLIKDLAKRYKEENIDVNNYFNIIISISDKKAFGYRTGIDYRKDEVFIPEGTKIYYPKRFGDNMNGSIVYCENSYTLFREFLTALSNNLEQRQHFFIDFTDYLWE